MLRGVRKFTINTVTYCAMESSQRVNKPKDLVKVSRQTVLRLLASTPSLCYNLGEMLKIKEPSLDKSSPEFAGCESASFIK